MGCNCTDTKPSEKSKYLCDLEENKDVGEAVKLSQYRINEVEASMQLELHLACKNLKNVDILSLTDSACVVYMRSSNDQVFEKKGETEVITDNLNPEFVKGLTIEYFFEKKQEIMVEVYDIDDFKANSKIEQNFIGSASFFLYEILRDDMSLEKDIQDKNKKNMGTLLITAIERKRFSNSIIKFEFKGKFFIPEYIFYRLYSMENNARAVPIFESETSRKLPHSPIHPFKEQRVHSMVLFDDDENKNAMIKVFKWSSTGDHTEIGAAQFSSTELLWRFINKIYIILNIRTKIQYLIIN